MYRFEVRLELYGTNDAPRSKGRPSLPSSALPGFLLPSFPPLSYLPRFLLPLLLPQFLCPASLPPHRPSSMSPFHPGGSGRVAKQAAHTSISFDLSRPLVSYTVSTTASKKFKLRIPAEIICTRFKYQTVETIRIFYKIVYGRRRSLPTLAKFQLVWPQPCQLSFFTSQKPKRTKSSPEM